MTTVTMQGIREKVGRGERLTFEDGVFLYGAPLIEVGELANEVRERKNGNVAYWVSNRHLNYSNVCVLTCLFCAFARKPGEEGAYEYSLEEAFRKAEELKGTNATEIHIVGGLHPDLPWEYYTDLLRGIKARMPHLHLKAFTAVEIDFFARTFGKTVEQVLRELVEAGLDSLPGGGAEMFSERVRKKVCKFKITGDEWKSIHRAAHGLGLRSTATMLYGHIETPADCVDHMLQLRELQDETGGFTAFIPLLFHPENSLLSHIRKSSGLLDLRHIAVSRLLLDNFAHIKVYWIMTGTRVAQVALSFGADDMDGTVREEKITHMAGATSPQGLTEDDLMALIREARREPVQRDTVYRSLEAVHA
ncbi:MAG: aminofutalosine synthase MqnE [Candidatus Brocadiae bacterium]|nr:aminofutalosine synthase MqnE [Candidatus Brocadiia bacterium]